MGITGVGVGELLALSVRTLIVLAWLIVLLRLVRGRPSGELKTFHILVLLVVANAVQNAMTKSDGHLSVGLVSAGTLLVAGWLIGLGLRRRPWLEKRMLGSPVVLVRDGQVIGKHLKSQGLTESDLNVAARKQGLDEISQAKLAVFEMDGSISVVPKSESHGGA